MQDFKTDTRRAGVEIMDAAPIYPPVW